MKISEECPCGGSFAIDSENDSVRAMAYSEWQAVHVRPSCIRSREPERPMRDPLTTCWECVAAHHRHLGSRTHDDDVLHEQRQRHEHIDMCAFCQAHYRAAVPDA